MKTTILLATAAALAIAGCGGGSDDADSAATTEPAASTSATTTAAPTTTSTPPTTAAPTTAVPTTAAPVTTATPTTAAELELGPFCTASEEYYVTSTAILEHVDTDGAAAFLFPIAIAEADAAVSAAPSPGFATEPAAARDALQALSDALTPVDFDSGRLEDPASLQAPFEVVQTTAEALEVFLRDGCSSDIGALDGRAQSLAESTDAVYGAAAPEPDDPVVESSSLTDDSGQLSLLAPGSWTEVRGAPDGAFRQLIAAADVDAFLASFTVPGLYLLSGDAPDAQAAVDTVVPGIRDGAVSQGCNVSISLPYDDGRYTGQEELLECPGGDAVFHLIGGTNQANDVWFALALVVELGDSETRDLVGDSFLVD